MTQRKGRARGSGLAEGGVRVGGRSRVWAEGVGSPHGDSPATTTTTKSA